MRPRRVVAMCGPETERGALMRFALDLLPQLRIVRVADAAAIAGMAEPALILCENPEYGLLTEARAQWPWLKVVAFGHVPSCVVPLVHVMVADGVCFLPRLRDAVLMALTRKRGPRPVRAAVEPRRETVAA